MSLDKPLLGESPSSSDSELVSVKVKGGGAPAGGVGDWSGLSSADVRSLRDKYGFNELAEKKRSPLLQFLAFFWGPMPWLIEIAAGVSLGLQDWKDFGFLFGLLFINGCLGFYEEFKAGNAVDALKKSLAATARVKRDGKWDVVPARELVPGDVIMLRLGDVAPADCNLGPGQPMEVDQAALTGESLPVVKYEGDLTYSGSVIKRGELEAVVSATGADTFFGKAAAMVDSVEQRGHFQLVLLRVATFLMVLAFVLVGVIFIDGITEKEEFFSLLKLCLVLLVASIPIAMQVVTTGTMAVGSRELARRQAIVSRLSAIEELAGMECLCSDKTGTLTKNVLTLDTPFLADKEVTADELIFAAANASVVEGEREAIDTAITAMADETELMAVTKLNWVPFDPVAKKTLAHLENPDGTRWHASKGSPQIILNLCSETVTAGIRARMDAKVNEYADRGYRTLGVASRPDVKGEPWKFLGLLPMFDPPRDDTKETIRQARKLGIEVKMVTGDHIAIAKETSRRLGMGSNIYGTEIFTETGGAGPAAYTEMIESADGFAEVYPEHKFVIVDLLQQAGYITGMTGDGVNDAPALKKADVGIAVQGATDAARTAADIVLVSPGLSVIVDAIRMSREIFQRMKSYCVYRIAATLQILFFFLLSILTYQFKLPVFVIVLISLVNDGTIISIAYDNVVGGPKPEAWDLPIVCATSAVLGGLAVFFSYFLLYLSKQPHFWDLFGLPVPAVAQARAMIYLQLSLSGQLTVFCARTRGFAINPSAERRPAAILMGAFMVAQTISTLLATYPLQVLSPLMGLAYNGPQQFKNHLTKDGKPFTLEEMLEKYPSQVDFSDVDAGQGWGFVLFIWVYALLCFLVQDVAKVAFYQWADYHDRQKMARLKEEDKLGALRVKIASQQSRSMTFLGDGAPPPDAIAARSVSRLRTPSVMGLDKPVGAGVGGRSTSSLKDVVFTNLRSDGTTSDGGVVRAGMGVSLSTAELPDMIVGLLKRVALLEEELEACRRREAGFAGEAKAEL
eukprot:PLAT7096.1.p1 GENE.PLAT7096.1~~PLAT7096.1.p1  ORF type:complete len:1023 (+),score=497.92 PLAT7096.1:26-3094(+)